MFMYKKHLIYFQLITIDIDAEWVKKCILKPALMFPRILDKYCSGKKLYWPF